MSDELKRRKRVIKDASPVIAADNEAELLDMIKRGEWRDVVALVGSEEYNILLRRL